jgi:uncharacterized glyoxalase superfamily protein PhnB
MLKKLTPNLMVESVKETLNFYINVLGFSFVMGVSPNNNQVQTEYNPSEEFIYAMLKYESIEIMLQSKESLSADIPVFRNKSVQASVSFYFDTAGLDRLYNDLKGKVKIAKDVAVTWYGMKEFYILDNNGYVLGFAEAVNG